MALPHSRRLRIPAPLAVFMAALAIVLPFHGSRGIYETSEGRYAECAREMLTSGQFFVPTLWGEHHLTKPPMTYWAIAGGMRLLGHNGWGVRLYGALAFALCAAFVYETGRRLWGPRTGGCAAAVFVTAPLAFFGATATTTDILLCAWEAGAMMCLVAAWRERDPVVARRWITAAWTLFGLGFLTKGPPALLPLAAVALWRRRAVPRLPLATAPGILLFALLGVGWFAGLRLAGEIATVDLIRREVFGRVTSSSGHNSRWIEAFTVYLPPLTVGMGVWMAVAAVATVRERPWKQPARAQLLASPAARLLLWWILLPLAVFACSRSRLTLYVLPLSVPLSLGLSAWMHRRGWPSPRAIRIIALASAATWIAVKAAMAWMPSERDMRALADVCLQTGGGPGARYILVNRSRMNGLRFYLDGNLTRLSFGRTVERAEGQLRPFLDQAARADVHAAAPRAAVLIVHTADAATVASALVRRGLQVAAATSWYEWHVWALGAPGEASREHDGQ